VTIITADVSNAGSVRKAFETVSRGGQVDAYINNAGSIADIAAVGQSDAENWWKAGEINMRGSLLMVQHIMRTASPNAVIINVFSGIAHVPYVPGHSAYAVSKIGASKLFEYVQYENPEFAISNLQPGIIESSGIASNAAAGSGTSWPQQDTRTWMIIIIVDVWLKISIVQLPANFMVWLSSPEAVFLKGRAERDKIGSCRNSESAHSGLTWVVAMARNLCSDIEEWLSSRQLEYATQMQLEGRKGLIYA
jgi:NAD(P)-dependent dehydrogenase (short-subunit alcohol dehydrogenase family)